MRPVGDDEHPHFKRRKTKLWRELLTEQLIELKFRGFPLALRRAHKALAEIVSATALKLDAKKREVLLAEFAECISIDDCVEFTRRHMGLGSCQIPSEIARALEYIAEIRPEIICEIGTFDGGTSVLFRKFLPTAKTMICVDLFVKNKSIIKLLASAGNQIKFFDMPSHHEQSVSKVKNFLGGQLLDMLFIDGDHRYEGVKQDFLRYRSFVREGGLILFHDIVETSGRTRAWAGGVPRLWKELAPHYPHVEVIDKPDQEGFGIGILTHTKDVELPLALIVPH